MQKLAQAKVKPVSCLSTIFEWLFSEFIQKIKKNKKKQILHSCYTHSGCALWEKKKLIHDDLQGNIFICVSHDRTEERLYLEFGEPFFDDTSL